MLKQTAVVVFVLGLLIDSSQQLPGFAGLNSQGVLQAVMKVLERNPDSVEARMKLQELLNKREDAMKLADDGLSKEQMKSVLEAYMKEHIAPNFPDPYGVQTEQKALGEMMKRYLESQKQLSDLASLGARSDFRHLAESFMDDGDLDEMQTIYIMALKKLMEINGESTPKQEMLYSVVFHALQNPEDKMIQELAGKAIDEASIEDKQILAIMFLHSYKNPKMPEARRELAKKGLEVVMSGNLATEDPAGVGFLLLQHYVGMKYDNKRDVMGMLLVQSLLDQDDEYSRHMAAQLVLYMVTAKNEIKDIEEEDRWKWQPPKVCHVETGNGEVIVQQECPHMLQCNVGPTPVTINGTSFRATMCAYPTQYLLFHTCKVDYANGTNAYTTACGSGECTIGPVSVQWDNVNLDAYYCSSIPENIGKEMTISDRTCSIVDEQYFVVNQRHCPPDYACHTGPFEIPNMPGYGGYVCKEVEDDDNFLTEVLGSLLGLSEDQMKAIASGNVTMESKAASEKQFLDYITYHLNERANGETIPQDADTVGLLILKAFVEQAVNEMGSAGMAQYVLDTLWFKKEKWGLDENDRIMMQTLILAFVQGHKEQQQMEEQASVREMMEAHMDDHREMKEDQNEQVLNMLKLLLQRQQEGQGDTSDSEEMDLMDVLKKLMEHMEDKNDDKQDGVDALKKIAYLLFKDRKKEDRMQAAYYFLRNEEHAIDMERWHKMMFILMFGRLYEEIHDEPMDRDTADKLMSKFWAVYGGDEYPEPQPEPERSAEGNDHLENVLKNWISGKGGMDSDSSEGPNEDLMRLLQRWSQSGKKK